MSRTSRTSARCSPAPCRTSRPRQPDLRWRMRRVPNSLAMQARHHPREAGHVRLIGRHVRDAKTLTPLEEFLGDRVDRPSEDMRRVRDLVSWDAEALGRVALNLLDRPIDGDDERLNLQLELRA